MTLPSKAAMEIAEVISIKIWGGVGITGENVVERTASLIDAHPEVMEMRAVLHSISQNGDALSEATIDAILPNWQPQEET